MSDFRREKGLAAPESVASLLRLLDPPRESELVEEALSTLQLLQDARPDLVYSAGAFNSLVGCARGLVLGPRDRPARASDASVAEGSEEATSQNLAARALSMARSTVLGFADGSLPKDGALDDLRALVQVVTADVTVSSEATSCVHDLLQVSVPPSRTTLAPRVCSLLAPP